MNDQSLQEPLVQRPTPAPWRIWDPAAAVAGIFAAVLLLLAIFLGSSNLQNFDSALVGYALATLFLAFGATYRMVSWARSPAAKRYLKHSRRLLDPRPKGHGSPVAAAGTFASVVLLQRFISRRSKPRWLAHQGLFWGVLLATAVTFPLTFGWIHFRADPGTASGYFVHVMGVRTARLDALSLLGWLTFHALDVASLLIIAGGGYFLWHRWTTRGNNMTELARDVLPLLALMAISISGLALTVSSALLSGAGYQALAFFHMCTVVLTLVWIPFGKFFHTFQRPAMAGVALHKRQSADRLGQAACNRCGEPLEGVEFVRDLQGTVAELGMSFGGWIETCPRCKRLKRAAAYRQSVKEGYR